MRLHLCALAALLSAPAAADPGPPLQPTGKWVVNFDDAQCFAARNYGTAEEPLVLALKAPPAGDIVQINVVRQGRGGRYAEQIPVEIATGASEPIETTMVAFDDRENGQRIYRMNVALEHLPALRRGKVLTIDGDSELHESFALEQMADVFKLMDECVAGLRELWNYAPGEAPNPTFRRRATGDLASAFEAADYPSDALREDQEGRATVVVLIDEQGKVADCTVTKSSGAAVLDAQSCAVIRARAEFEPAIGVDGRPIKDLLTQTVNWRIR